MLESLNEPKYHKISKLPVDHFLNAIDLESLDFKMLWLGLRLRYAHEHNFSQPYIVAFVQMDQNS